MKKRRSGIIKYSVSLLVGALIAWGVLSTHGFFAAETAAERYRFLCDAFFVPGVLMMAAGALIFVANDGLFNGIAYAARYVARMFVPWSGKRDESYGDFVASRSEKGGIKGYSFLFAIGGLYLALSVLFLILYYTA